MGFLRTTLRPTAIQTTSTSKNVVSGTIAKHGPINTGGYHVPVDAGDNWISRLRALGKPAATPRVPGETLVGPAAHAPAGGATGVTWRRGGGGHAIHQNAAFRERPGTVTRKPGAITSVGTLPRNASTK